MKKIVFISLISVLISHNLKAEENILIQGANTKITSRDVVDDALRIPEATRKSALSRTDVVQQVATGLYLRRVYAFLARTEGISTDPAIQAAIRQSEEKILADAFLAKTDEKYKPTEAELEKQALVAYTENPKRFELPDQIRASHILVSKGEKNGRAKAEKLLVELKAGAKFAEVAKQKSDDSGSAARGGDLGFFSKGQMVPEFEKAAFSLNKIHEISKVIETQFGWHIIRLEERKKAGHSAFDEVKARLKAEIVNKAIANGRAIESKKMLEQARINSEAIEAFSSTYR